MKIRLERENQMARKNNTIIDKNKKVKRSLIGKYWVFIFWLLLSLQVIYRLYISTNQLTFSAGAKYFVYSLIFILPMSLAISLVIAFLISLFIGKKG